MYFTYITVCFCVVLALHAEVLPGIAMSFLKCLVFQSMTGHGFSWICLFLVEVDTKSLPRWYQLLIP